ncbi:hypothetical protein KIW84_012503 [Lathyrus oleraceus]|uniref:Uncharacterized protein n=1 Tax=Pisum sativum TaxID=3888 RepID=A0A9D5GWU4_PEA|nr:hypothetical protein KIW84_012503 [Pisum sativum]
MGNFILSGILDKKKIVIVAWKTCCKYLKEGGLGLKSLKTFNGASNLHLCWKLFQDNNIWSSLFASMVRRNNRVIKHSIKSSLWSSIKDNFGIVKDNTHWLIGTGKLTNFWLDSWLDEPLTLKFKIPEILHNTLTAKVQKTSF